MLPWTSAALIKAGHDPVPMEQAAHRNFNAVGRHQRGHLVRSALYASDSVTEEFWKVFCAAARVLRGGGEEMKEAA